MYNGEFDRILFQLNVVNFRHTKFLINFNNLILVFQNNSLHFTLNRLKCEKQILLSMGFEPTTPAFAVSDFR